MTQEIVLRQPTAAEIAQAKLPAQYDSACTAIAACEDLLKLKDYADRQAALVMYFRLWRDDTLRLRALRLQARAEQRAGELLNQIPDGRGANQNIEAGAVPKVTRTAAAEAAGMSERQRKTAQRIGRIPKPEFEAAVESETPPTITELAERGMISRGMPPARSAAPAPAASDADRESAAEAQRALAAFAEFCDEHDARQVARTLARADAQAMRSRIVHIGEWLDAFISGLSAKSAAA